MKWTAMFSMVVDHINKVLLDREIAWMYNFGRLAFPLFLLVFVYNFTRSHFFEGTHRRVFSRLLVFAVISSVPFIWIHYLIGGTIKGVTFVLPLNILFSLLAVGFSVFLIEKKNYTLAVLLMLLSGFLVEYFWAGILLGVGLYFLFRKQIFIATMLLFIGAFLLLLINNSIWTLLVVPLALVLSRIPITLPRAKWFFYGFYPAHLTILLAVYLLRSV